MSLYGSKVRFDGIHENFERTSSSGLSDEITIVYSGKSVTKLRITRPATWPIRPRRVRSRNALTPHAEDAHVDHRDQEQEQQQHPRHRRAEPEVEVHERVDVDVQRQQVRRLRRRG